jgi:hypothetical protein
MDISFDKNNILTYNEYIDVHNIKGNNIRNVENLNFNGYIHYLLRIFEKEFEFIKNELHCHTMNIDNKMDVIKIKDYLEKLKYINTKFFNFANDVYMHEGLSNPELKVNFKRQRIIFLYNILMLITVLQKYNIEENNHIMNSLNLLDECNDMLYSNCVPNTKHQGLQGTIINALKSQKTKTYKNLTIAC